MLYFNAALSWGGGVSGGGKKGDRCSKSSSTFKITANRGLSPEQKAGIKVWRDASVEALGSGIQSCNCWAGRGQTVSRK